MDPLLIPYGSPVDSLWNPYGLPYVFDINTYIYILTYVCICNNHISLFLMHSPYGFPMVSPWPLPIDSLWVPYGFHRDSPWPLPIDFLWIPYGFPMDFLWIAVRI